MSRACVGGSQILQFEGILENIQAEFIFCVLKINNNNNITPAALMYSIVVIHFCLL